jgi:hypothetical protein
VSSGKLSVVTYAIRFGLSSTSPDRRAVGAGRFFYRRGRPNVGWNRNHVVIAAAFDVRSRIVSVVDYFSRVGCRLTGVYVGTLFALMDRHLDSS